MVGTLVFGFSVYNVCIRPHYPNSYMHGYTLISTKLEHYVDS